MSLVRLCVLMALGTALCADQSVLAQVKSAVVDAAVKDLQSESADVREGGEVRLYGQPPEEFPAIEAASKRTDLKPATIATLKQIVDTVRPLLGRRTRALRGKEAERQWLEQALLASYDAVGKRNPKWDRAAKDGLAKACEDGDPIEQFGAVDKATQLGCDDPMIVAIKARYTVSMKLADAIMAQNEMVRAAEGLAASRYPASVKLPELAYANQHSGHPVAALMDGKVVKFPPDPRSQKLLAAALVMWPDVLKETDMPESLVVTRAQDVTNMGAWTTGETKPTFDTVIAAMQKEPRHTPAMLVYKGVYYTDYAWDARGRGLANTVSEEGFRQMQERLVVAAEALNKAFDMNPNDPAAATEMLTVELGQGKGKGAMELWFGRAMKANPDNYEACEKKMYYLEPKWYGTPEEMLAFGRACRDSKNWFSRIPLLLVDAHDRLSRYEPAGQHFKKPEAWADIQSVYKPLLNAWPENHFMRSKYAYYACMCGQWAEAKKQFDRLGDNADGKPFGGDDRLYSFKQRAMSGGR